MKVFISTSYEENIEKTEKVLKNLIIRLNKELDELKSDITIEGIDSLNTSSVDYLLTMHTSYRNQFSLKRKILKEIKIEFDKNNIKIPYTQIEVHYDK